MAGLCAIVMLCAKRLPYAAVGWFWFLGTLVPVIGLVQVGNQSMADRYTYLPLIGLFIFLAWGSAELISRWKLPLPVAFLLGLALLAGWGGANSETNQLLGKQRHLVRARGGRNGK